MTPESMVAKLDEFESMAEDAVSQEDRDVSLHTLNTVSSGFSSLLVFVVDVVDVMGACCWCWCVMFVFDTSKISQYRGNGDVLGESTIYTRGAILLHPHAPALSP